VVELCWRCQVSPALLSALASTISSGSIKASGERNDRTLDARASHLSYWLDRIDLPLCTLLGQGPDTVNLTLAAYGQWVGEGNSIRGSKIVSATMAAYLSVAVALLEQHDMDNPIRLTRSGQPHQKLHPDLVRVLNQHKLICVERHTRQPITRGMIDIMMYLDNHASSTGDFGWAISWSNHCDWMILGLFTGYRIGEYGQTDNCSYRNCARGARGNRSGEYPDFLFFYFFSNTVPYTNKLNCIIFIETRLRWQKSMRHGQFRTFKVMPNDPLRPMTRARRILLRADTLRTPPRIHVAVFRIPETGAATYVKRITVKRFLKKALIVAYPDPNHRRRHLEQCFMPHCLRVSACLAVVLAGVHHNDVVCRLRWNSDAVDI
jgi:hypothetical protein